MTIKANETLAQNSFFLLNYTGNKTVAWHGKSGVDNIIKDIATIDNMTYEFNGTFNETHYVTFYQE